MDKAIVSYSKIFNSNNSFDGSLVSSYIDELTKLDKNTPPLEAFILVTNTSKQSYEYIGKDFERTLGLDRSKMISEGLKYYISHYHPDDLPILLKVFEDLMHFTMTELDKNQRQRVVYTWNYRIRKGNGEYKNMFVQQTPIFFDNEGRPIIGYSQNTVVGDSHPRPLIATCKLLNKKDDFELLFSRNYIFLSLKQLLTNRELEIVKLLANSYGSKEIANILHISKETVSVHRRNILKKLNMKSTFEITEYCNKYRVFSHSEES